MYMTHCNNTALCTIWMSDVYTALKFIINRSYIYSGHSGDPCGLYWLADGDFRCRMSLESWDGDRNIS